MSELRIRWIYIDNPPVNALGPNVRRIVFKQIKEAITDRPDAIVISGRDRYFSAGADVKEFAAGLDPDSPDPNDISALLEASPVPTIALINGAAFGGGLELALSCHDRLIMNDASVGLPEVTLGVIPGAGGTQRLPRIIGLPAALKLILSGQTIDAEEAVSMRLATRVGDDGVEAAIKTMIKKHTDRLSPVCNITRMPEDSLTNTELEIEVSWNCNLETKVPGALCRSLAVKSVLDSTRMDFDKAILAERRSFEICRSSIEGRAAQHVFFAERNTRNVANIDSSVTPKLVKRALVVGAGTMGSGIATAFLQSGLSVTLCDAHADALEEAKNKIEKNLRRHAEKTKGSAVAADSWISQLDSIDKLEVQHDIDIAIEAVYEDLDVKNAIITHLENQVGTNTIIASNTSALDLNAIATKMMHPERFIGLHFFSPANIMRLVEVVRTDTVSDHTLVTTLKMARNLDKVPVVCGVCPGFIANRMLYPFLRQVDSLILEGASPLEIDNALESFGFAMGPCRMLDMAGQDIAYSVRQDQLRSLPKDFFYPLIADRLVEAGRLGIKSGQGWYQYKPGDRKPYPDPSIEQIIETTAEEAGIERRKVTAEEIVERCILRLILEGALVLEDGIAQRPSDIDVCFVFGLGFSKYLGGPMFYSDEMGITKFADRIEDMERKFGPEWTLPPLIIDLLKEKKSFSDLDKEHSQ